MTEKTTHTVAAPFIQSSTAVLRDALLALPGAALDRLTPLHGEPSPIVGRAREQHSILHRALSDSGVRVHVLEPASHATGYESFIGDCALVVDRGAILLRPHRIERRREVAAVEARLAELGVPIVGRIEAPGLLDGGDIVMGSGTAYIGVSAKGQRSNTIGRAQLDSLLSGSGIRTSELTLAPEIPRLNDVFSVISDDLVVAATDYVDLARIGRPPSQIVSLPRGEQFGASLISIGPRRVIANLRFRIALPIVRKAKVDVIAIDLWEFGKVGGGPPSLVLPLKRGS